MAKKKSKSQSPGKAEATKVVGDTIVFDQGNGVYAGEVVAITESGYMVIVGDSDTPVPVAHSELVTLPQEASPAPAKRKAAAPAPSVRKDNIVLKNDRKPGKT